MGAWLTNHVKVQMALRGISEAEIYAVLADPKQMTDFSKSNKAVWLITGKAGERILTVVVNRVTEGVITAHVAKRKVRREYENRA